MFEHLAAGSLGVRQAHDLARVHANPRITDQIADVIDSFVTVAEQAPYDQFVTKLTEWARLADADGSHRDAGLAHERRSAHLSKLGESTFLDLRVGAIQGDTLVTILDGFEQAEFTTDWDATKARHGDAATTDLMPRTAAQRRADAIVAIFEQAAATNPATVTSPLPVVDIVIEQPVYEEQLRAMVDGRRPDFSRIDPIGRTCTTTGGTPVDPATAVAASLVGHVRRVVVDGQGRIIDFGRRKRLFTGAAREAALVQAILDGLDGRCLWPGCGRRRTQLDHNEEWQRDHGRTDLHNSGPFCGPHNLIKTTGYRTWRDCHGTWHLQRPDGTEMRAA